MLLFIKNLFFIKLQLKDERKILGLCLLISETETAQPAPLQDHQHRHVPVPRREHHEGQKIYQNKAREWRKIRTNEVKLSKFLIERTQNSSIVERNLFLSVSTEFFSVGNM